MHGTFQTIGTEAGEFDAVAMLGRAGEEAQRELWRWSAAVVVAMIGGVAGLAGGVILGVVTGLIGLC